MDGVEVAEVLQVLKMYFLPDASDHVYQDVWKFLHHKRTDQTMERFLLEFDLLRTKAEREIQRGFQRERVANVESKNTRDGRCSRIP